MSGMLRKLRRIALYLILVTVILASLYISILAFPGVFFSHRITKGSLTFYSDMPFDSDLIKVTEQVRDRVAAIDIYDPELRLYIYLCDNEDLYSTYARLSLVPVSVPGFNLSIFRNSFISLPGLKRRFIRTGGQPLYSAVGGDPAQNIAHELVHNYFRARYGYFGAKLPYWKSEGLAEYYASIGASKYDSLGGLHLKISQIPDLDLERQGLQYYQGSLIIEYLVEIKGLSYDEIASDEIVFDKSREWMMDWYNGDTDVNSPR